MSYTMASGRYANTVDVILEPGVTARTATFQGPAVEVGDKGDACLDLTTTAASGTTPTLNVAVETSKDGTTWRSLGTFAQQTGAATERKSFAGCDRFIRANATIAGTTPSFTFTCKGEAK